jgi:dolichol-phosphate mannosyltransferase
MDVCVALPVLNEIENIPSLLDGIRQNLNKKDYIICLVDDGSLDGTVGYIEHAMATPNHRLHLIRRQKITYGSQRGSALFAAMAWALQHTNCWAVVEMDGDLSHRPEELGIGLKMLSDGVADVVVASKFLQGSTVTNRPLGRRLVSQICNLAVRLIISTKVRDFSNGYRFYTRRAAELVAATTIRYASPIYLTEVMAIWLSHSLKIIEFPTHYVGRNEGLSKLRPIDLLKASVAVFEIAIRLHITGFKSNMILSRRPRQGTFS